MILSYLKVGFNIGIKDIQIYEDDSNINLEEFEERIKTLREEVLRAAPDLKDVFALFKKG
jgi:hypothetical protein